MEASAFSLVHPTASGDDTRPQCRWLISAVATAIVAAECYA